MYILHVAAKQQRTTSLHVASTTANIRRMYEYNQRVKQCQYSKSKYTRLIVYGHEVKDPPIASVNNVDSGNGSFDWSLIKVSKSAVT